MPDNKSFAGFTQETVRFFEGLRRHNDRDWFEKNRAIYEAHVMEPAKAFVTAVGARLKTRVPRIVAAPQVNKSIFRLNRDTRFSPDPSPYKTNLGIFWWEGPRTRMEAPGFYFHLEPPTLLFSVGSYIVPKPALERFRRAVVDPRRGLELARLVADLKGIDGAEIGGQHYKRVPAGYDPGHPNAELLKHTGLYLWVEGPIPEEFYTARLVDLALERFERFLPLHRWLVKALG
jgi:uncharacterized protein (TIGR02453 family)